MNFLNKNILITGGAGFIGSHLVNCLLNTDCALIRIIDSNPVPINLAPYRFDPRIEYICGDIRNYKDCCEACQNINICIHLAAFSSVPLSQFSNECVEINVSGTINIINAAKSCGVSRFIFASSSSIYCDQSTSPVSSCKQPLSVYAITKYTCEIIIQNHNIICVNPNSTMECVCLRYFNVYNVTTTCPGVVGAFLRARAQSVPPKIFGSGSQLRDYIHVNDVCKATMVAATIPNPEPVYNVGTGVATSLTDLLDLIGRGKWSMDEITIGPATYGDAQSRVSDEPCKLLTECTSLAAALNS